MVKLLTRLSPRTLSGLLITAAVCAIFLIGYAVGRDSYDTPNTREKVIVRTDSSVTREIVIDTAYVWTPIFTTGLLEIPTPDTVFVAVQTTRSEVPGQQAETPETPSVRQVLQYTLPFADTLIAGEARARVVGELVSWELDYRINYPVVRRDQITTITVNRDSTIYLAAPGTARGRLRIGVITSAGTVGEPAFFVSSGAYADAQFGPGRIGYSYQRLLNKAGSAHLVSYRVPLIGF